MLSDYVKTYLGFAERPVPYAIQVTLGENKNLIELVVSVNPIRTEQEQCELNKQ